MGTPNSSSLGKSFSSLNSRLECQKYPQPLHRLLLPSCRYRKHDGSRSGPYGTQTTLFLVEGESGVFQASTVAPFQGVYRFHVVASGVTMRGLPFTCEQLLSGVVVPGSDNPCQREVLPHEARTRRCADSCNVS